MASGDRRAALGGEEYEETRDFNRDLARRLSLFPDQWSFPPSVIRERRAEGLGPFPAPPKLDHAETLIIPGPHGDIPLRILRPQTRPCQGVFLHLHGGGWTLGGASEQDPRLAEIAERTGLAAVSVEYRLAPEHPYPQAPDDCEAAALWLHLNGADVFGPGIHAIGGESAGANLAATTLLRLRDRHGLSDLFAGAVFSCGCFDLRLTPSARNWGEEKLVLNTRDISMFARHYLADGHSPYDPDISPLLARLEGMVPAHFSVGTRDPLLDDTLFMAERWRAAGNVTELAVYPGGCHVFQRFDLRIARESNQAIDRFLAHLIPSG
ncbi:MAG: alpha/beta hydrolase [Stappia sp.]|jgi:acetyl esterase/lipase|uniref:alpha/beta hydrolase n=1 Tax=Stappia sp. TaxID=1870903 RepID=UPI000C6947D7|nr:alpha/beta hydrolase [Stappia sp.]MAB00499.1 alpha/beta hydrolase [Stappia sp.]MBM18611.1 alpha/beta hydrolase [Stappia sp.]